MGNFQQKPDNRVQNNIEPNFPEEKKCSLENGEAVFVDIFGKVLFDGDSIVSIPTDVDVALPDILKQEQFLPFLGRISLKNAILKNGTIFELNPVDKTSERKIFAVVMDIPPLKLDSFRAALSLADSSRKKGLNYSYYSAKCIDESNWFVELLSTDLLKKISERKKQYLMYGAAGTAAIAAGGAALYAASRSPELMSWETLQKATIASDYIRSGDDKDLSKLQRSFKSGRLNPGFEAFRKQKRKQQTERKEENGKKGRLQEVDQEEEDAESLFDPEEVQRKPRVFRKIRKTT